MTAQNIDDVVDRSAGIAGEAGRTGDRAGRFAALHRQVTVETRTAVRSGLFGDGPRTDRSGTLFGSRYLDAFDAWRRDRSGPRCWRGTFALLEDADTGTVVVQHLVLGVNAHTSLDPAVAAAQSGPGRSVHAPRHGFLLINDILARVVPAVRDSLDAPSP
ncbi:DUF5995 family protein [Streptomyces sp. NPDC090075]|uniref:DUF5995 family protein n=1 Tax=Streptomyces sp. NPDC090075 TaxID=3365937 RepID=UPI00380C1439